MVLEQSIRRTVENSVDSVDKSSTASILLIIPIYLVMIVLITIAGIIAIILDKICGKEEEPCECFGCKISGPGRT